MVTTVLYQVAFRHYSNFYNSFTNNNNNPGAQKRQVIQHELLRVNGRAKIPI